MRYVSTRGGMEPVSFSQALLLGLAPDGGLLMPEQLPKLDEQTLRDWQKLSYQELALAIMSLFIDDIDAPDLRTIIERSYSINSFADEAVTPVTQLEKDLFLLELSNGPSLAFKDIAMQFLGEAFAYVLAKRGERINILGATSGDTGSAAEYAMLGKDNVNVFMLSPHERMSAFQQAQMYSLNEPNIFNIAIKGVFDDCQDLVKAVNSDAQFKQKYQIGAVNSINWARVLAQTVYYFKAYFALAQEVGEQIDFCVPSGNFGNVFAGYVAKLMGLPIGKLLVACNENDVLYEFFTTKTYRVRPSAQVAKTSSPSMDIGKASNFERYMYYLADKEGKQVSAWWQELQQKGEFSLEPSFAQKVEASDFIAGRSTHANRIQTIAEIDAKYGRLIDPHTADGVFVAREYQARQSQIGAQANKMVCLETALPAKFAETVREAVGREPERPSRFADIEAQERFCEVMEADVAQLKSYIVSCLE